MDPEKPTVLLGHYLKELKLPTFLREYRKIAEPCGKDRTDYQTFLLRLVEREIQDREVRARERRVKAAKFPVVKTLDSFDFKAQPSINQPLVRELMSGGKTPELSTAIPSLPTSKKPILREGLSMDNSSDSRNNPTIL